MEKKKTPSQREAIRALLLKGYSITPLEALTELGCYRLQARISELKAEGMKIITVMVDGGTSRISGKRIRYARYTLAKS